ncbi:MAG: DNA repair protein RecO [Saprospiraceae bacterium]
MYIHSQGILLRTVKYSESSMILDMYTLDKGRRSFIISGIRSKQAKTKAGLLQVMGLVDFVSYNKDTNSLIRIKEIKADQLYQKIPFDVLRSCLGVFMMEVCAKAIKETEANPHLFDFIRATLLRLDELELSRLSLLHIQFLLGLSKHLGFAIQNDYTENNCYLSYRDGCYSDRDFGPQYSMDKDSSVALHQIMLKRIDRVPKKLRDKILDQLILFYKYHLDGFGTIKSLDVIRSVFSK